MAECKLSFEPLTRHIPLDSFKCQRDPGCADLEDFLKNDALKHQEQMIARTTLAYQGDVLVGFYALSCHMINIAPPEKERFQITYNYPRCPTLLLARLAVHEDYWGRQIGTKLLSSALNQSWDISQLTGCRFLIAHAYENRGTWYEKNGFEIMDSPRKREQSRKIIDTSSFETPPTVTMRFDLLSLS